VHRGIAALRRAADREGRKHGNSGAHHACGGRHLDGASADPPWLRALLWLAIALPYVAIVVRGKLMMVDPAQTLADPRFVIELQPSRRR
jgi:hypothetical protein